MVIGLIEEKGRTLAVGVQQALTVDKAITAVTLTFAIIFAVIFSLDYTVRFC